MGAMTLPLAFLAGFLAGGVFIIWAAGRSRLVLPKDPTGPEVSTVSVWLAEQLVRRPGRRVAS